MDKIDKCMGDPDADAENDVLRTEQIVQVCQSVMLADS